MTAEEWMEGFQDFIKSTPVDELLEIPGVRGLVEANLEDNYREYLADSYDADREFCAELHNARRP